jgi:chemotaxis protein CheD
MKKIVNVGIAEMKTAQNRDIIRTAGLGSCVGIVLYDETKQLSGLAHVMLPDSALAKTNTFNKAKYADTAILALIEMLTENGVDKHSLKAKIAGGAQMFHYSTQNEAMRIGPRNVQVVKGLLEQLEINIIAEDTGGVNGRTIEFNTETNELMIRTVYKGVTVI